MTCLKPEDLTEIDRDLLRDLNRETLEKLAWQAVELARDLANRLHQDSTNSSRPPSSDKPYGRGTARAAAKGDAADRRSKGPGEDGDDDPDGSASPTPQTPPKPPAKPSGKRPGMPGSWRTQPLVVTDTVDHRPVTCAGCGAPLDPAARSRCLSAHYVYDLERGAMALRVTCTKHRYFAAECACGQETQVAPASGARSALEGRKRDLELTERGLVGPMLATFIAALSLRARLSRARIQEFLLDWLGLELGTATINRCIHEFGLACEPVVEDLLKEVRTAEVVNLDETPWYQGRQTLWLWVMVTATITVYHIGSRHKVVLSALIGEAFLGWLVSDGYAAYRDHPRRQRCLAHLIRKAVALATGFYRNGSQFGRDLVRDLRDLIQAVAAGGEAERIRRLVRRLKWSCECNKYDDEEKVRALAREILNDWEAVIAFVHDPTLPATNNDAERALRHAVIARRISFGTRTDEGSRFYAAGLSVIETCRKRGVDAWTYARELITAARAGRPHPSIPMGAAAP